jgi:hypothetical protein
MAEGINIPPSEIGNFLSNISGATCYTMGIKMKKAKEMAPVVDVAIALGLLIAKKQPQLIDACIQHWNTTRPYSADEFVDMVFNVYRQTYNK